MPSIEEKVEYSFKKMLDNLGIKLYGKTEKITEEITNALKSANSKSGGSGRNYPDIQCLLDDGHSRRIPVMMECKGSKGRLEKLDNDGLLSKDQKATQSFAVNGAVHYGNALLSGIADLNEVIVIGMNGSQLDSEGEVKDLTCKAYYMSKQNNCVPKHIPELDDDLTLLAKNNTSRLYKILDNLFLSPEEREKAKRKTEEQLEASIKRIHQSLYDDEKMKTLLGTNDKLHLFTGLIMAGLKVEGTSPLMAIDFHGSTGNKTNDGIIILNRIEEFLIAKGSLSDKVKMILGLLQPVFDNSLLWKPKNGVSILKTLYLQVQEEIIPLLESPFHLDFSGKILNSLNDWVSIENDKPNDVVLTPRYVTSFMARLCRTDMNSMVWDTAMGSGGFLVSAMDIMIRDAQDKIKDKDELATKIKNIKEKQLLGIEILPNIYILAVLNMILMGDGSSKMRYEDSHGFNEEFPATVFLLNPPYSADGKGFNFVEEALNKMTTGYAAVLIQENAGAGQGGNYTKRLLQNNTLVCSIHMSEKLFSGKSSVQTAIYVFKVGEPHNEDSLVKFIDFSNDGYFRQNRRKSTQAVNLRDVDHATERYAEVEALVPGKKPKTKYYTKENGLYIEDTISLSGDDWTFAQHKKIDTVPTEEDFKKVVADYLSWKVGCLMKGEAVDNSGDGDDKC